MNGLFGVGLFTLLTFTCSVQGEKLEEYKFLAFLRKGQQFLCMVTLITNQHALTSAFCCVDLDLAIEGLHVLVAVNNPIFRRNKEHAIEEFTSDPDYTNPLYRITVITLKRKTDCCLITYLQILPELPTLGFGCRIRTIIWNDEHKSNFEENSFSTVNYGYGLGSIPETFGLVGYDFSFIEDGAPIFYKGKLMGIVVKHENIIICIDVESAMTFVRKEISKNFRRMLWQMIPCFH